MRPLNRRRATLLATCLITPVLAAVTPTIATAQSERCTTEVYADAPTAKSNFENDCGEPYRNTPDYRCDWVPGGWVCEGPGEATSNPTTSPRDQSSSKPPTPTIIQVEKEPGFVNVVWRPDARIKGVNVYRDGSWLASVNSPNNVYNDFGGREGATYALVAYGYDTDEFSDRAVAPAANDAMDPVVDLRVENLGGNRVVLNWTRANLEVTGWRIYRNGQYWRYLPVGQGHKDEIFDTDADNAFVYEVQAVRGARQSLRVGNFGPAAEEYVGFGPTGRSRVQPWPGNNTPLVEGLPARDATTRSLAARAEASSANAHEEYEDFQESWGGVAQAAVPLRRGAPGGWIGISAALLDVRTERMEAEAAFTEAFNDLQAYEECMATNCGAPQPPSNNGNDGDDDGPELETNGPSNNDGWGNRPCGEFC